MLIAGSFRPIDPHLAVAGLDMAGVAAGPVQPSHAAAVPARASFWPVADGRIESVNVSKQEGVFHSGRTPYAAELSYSYSVEGSVYGDAYKQEFATAEEGWEFVRDLKGKPVVGRSS